MLALQGLPWLGNPWLGNPWPRARAQRRGTPWELQEPCPRLAVAPERGCQASSTACHCLWASRQSSARQLHFAAALLMENCLSAPSEAGFTNKPSICLANTLSQSNNGSFMGVLEGNKIKNPQMPLGERLKKQQQNPGSKALLPKPNQTHPPQSRDPEHGAV